MVAAPTSSETPASIAWGRFTVRARNHSRRNIRQLGDWVILVMWLSQSSRHGFRIPISSFASQSLRTTAGDIFSALASGTTLPASAMPTAARTAVGKITQ